MKDKNVALAIAALMGLSTVALQPASASDLTRILGRLGGGSVNYGNQAQIQSNIQVGMTNLQTQIQQNVASGRISPIEASNINAEMNRVAAMNNDFLRDGVYSASEVQQMLNQFNNLNTMVSTATSGTLNSNLGYGYGNYNGYNNYDSRFGYGNRFAPSSSNVLSLQNRISSNISAAVSRRRMSVRSANNMRYELNTIVAKLNRPGLRVSKRNSLMSQLRSLDRQVASIGGIYY
jgi:hypothetical protein